MRQIYQRFLDFEAEIEAEIAEEIEAGNSEAEWRLGKFGKQSKLNCFLLLKIQSKLATLLDNEIENLENLSQIRMASDCLRILSTVSKLQNENASTSLDFGALENYLAENNGKSFPFDPSDYL